MLSYFDGKSAIYELTSFSVFCVYILFGNMLLSALSILNEENRREKSHCFKVLVFYCSKL